MIMQILNDQLAMLSEDKRDDNIKISTVHTLLSRLQFYNYHKERKEFLSMSFIHIQEDPQVYRLHNYNCSPALLKSIKQNRVCNCYKDTEEQYHIIYENFINLYKKHIPYGSRLNNEKPEIFISYITQFFLDRDLITENLMKVAMFACKKEQWIDIKTFTLCIEALQVNIFDSMYYYFVDPPSDIKRKYESQKLICNSYIVFFQFIDVQNKNSLSYLQVCEAYRITFRSLKESEITRKVHDIFQKLHAVNKSLKQNISIEEFLLMKT